MCVYVVLPLRLSVIGPFLHCSQHSFQLSVCQFVLHLSCILFYSNFDDSFSYIIWKRCRGERDKRASFVKTASSFSSELGVSVQMVANTKRKRA